MKSLRLNKLPDEITRALKAARKERGWSQAELGKKIRLPQAHISGIESGKIVPRYDTLLDVVRMLEMDLVLVPRQVVPVVKALIRMDDQKANQEHPQSTYAHYADDNDAEEKDAGPLGKEEIS